MNILMYLSRVCRQIIRRRRRFSLKSIFYILFILLVLHLLHLWQASPFFTPTYNTGRTSQRLSILVNNESGTKFDSLIPSNRFNLFWTMWNTHSSTFRGRRLLVLESIFIHHPDATIIMFSSTLDDAKLFSPFRQRGYRIHTFNISLQHMIDWHWYTNSQTRDFLQNWNTSVIHFYSHVSDYLRIIVLYLYGGTYLDMDALILQPLPQHEFIGTDRTELGDNCTWCIRNTSGQYLAPGFIRFRPGRQVLKDILEYSFNRQTYNPNHFICVGPYPYTYYIMKFRENTNAELTNLQLLQPERLYPFMWTEIYNVFYESSFDTSLKLADLMKRSYSLHLFGHTSDNYSIAQGSLIDLLFHRFDLGDLRTKALSGSATYSEACLVYPSVYIHNPRKQGQFIGRDVIYLRLNHTLANDNVRWTINMHVSNGTILLPSHRPLSNLNQAQVNAVLNEMSYKPFKSTFIDRLVIEVRSDDVIMNCSVTILVFSKWVTVVTKTMGTVDRWPVVQRLAASIAIHYPDTRIRIASDSGKRIRKVDFLNFTSADGINGYHLRKKIFIHNLPEDAGLSACRNYLVNATTTPFFFLLDDDFVFEEESHLDILLELIYTYSHIDIIAGKIPEDIMIFHDYAGIFLQYNETLELINSVSNKHKNQILFPRSPNNSLDKDNPCRQVDFVPNVFMGRKEAVQSVGWYDEYKVGEHEDFFFRFGHANRTVYTCDYIDVHHRQVHWWKYVNNEYYKKRARVFEYYRKMLQKHHLKRLITFGITNVDLDQIEKKSE